MRKLFHFFIALIKGWGIYIKNYSDVVHEIEKQNTAYAKVQNHKSRREINEYLQQLVKLHSELFNITWSTIVAFFALIISLVALFIALK